MEAAPGTSLFKLLSGSSTDLLAAPQSAAAADNDGLIKSLSDLFAGEDSGLIVFGASKGELQDDDGEHFKSKQQQQQQETIYSKWHGSSQNFDSSGNTELSSFGSPRNNKSAQLFPAYNPKISPTKLSNMTLKNEIQRMTQVRQQLSKHRNPLVVHSGSSSPVKPPQRQKSVLNEEKQKASTSSKLAVASPNKGQREPPSRNISDITMSPYRGSGLSVDSISDITLSPFSGGGGLAQQQQQRRMPSELQRAVIEEGPVLPTAEGEQPAAAAAVSNKCDHVLLHGTQKSELAGPEYLTKQKSCDFSPRKPTRSQNNNATSAGSKFDDAGSSDGPPMRCPIRRVSSDKILPDLWGDEADPVVDVEDQSHGEVVVVCPTPPSKRILSDSCPLETGFHDHSMCFHRSQSTPIVTTSAEFCTAPPKRPTRTRSKTANQSPLKTRCRSSDAVLPSPTVTSPRGKVSKAIMMLETAGAGKLFASDHAKTTSPPKSSRSKSVRQLIKSPQRKSQKQLGEQRSRRSVIDSWGASTRHLQGKRPSIGDSSASVSQQIERVAKLLSDSSEILNEATKEVAKECGQEPKTPAAQKRQIVLPGITDSFERAQSEGTMSTASGSSRDIAPVSPRRFRASFTTSNSCRGFNTRCNDDEKKEEKQQQQRQQEQPMTKKQDIVLPVLADTGDKRDYSPRSFLSPRKVSIPLRTSNSCRQFFFDDESLSKDTAPVSPRRVSRSPRKLIAPNSARALGSASEHGTTTSSPGRRTSKLLKKRAASCWTLKANNK